jgi:hypothetical protein
VEFKVGNIDLLKKALESMASIRKESVQIFISKHTDQEKVAFRDAQNNLFNINLNTGKLATSSGMDEKQLGSFSNQIKRAYSLQVIDEVAKKNKWINKKLGENRYQLQRF